MLALAGILGETVKAGAPGTAPVATPAPKTTPAKRGEFLFVQTSNAMHWDAATHTLSLTGVSPITVFFTDRPERVAGNMTTAAFVPFWSTGKHNFSTDPPIADLSILENGQLQQVVVELKSPC